MGLDEILGLNFIGLRKVLNIKFILLILLIFGVIFIVIDITKMYYKCPENVIEYRYIPRSFNEEQDNIVPIKDIFGSMFENPSPWVSSFTNTGSKRTNVRQN